MANIYFSDFFDVSPAALDDYGAFDISLVNDLPLFVDPFLLFNSDSLTYQKLHQDIIRYMLFLKEVTLAGGFQEALIDQWFAFPEVRQNWFGFSRRGNRGHGLGKDFARSLYKNFSTVFRNFGNETVTKSSHLEKLCLVRDGVGRDTISDFTTNLISQFLAEFTQEFGRQFLSSKQRRRVAVRKATFNYGTRSWVTREFDLPSFEGDYVLLTPKNILTKDSAWINRPELLNRFQEIADALPDAVLRAQVNEYLIRVLPRGPKPKEEDVHEAIALVIDKFPQVLDYYIRDKEDRGDEAESVARQRVRFVQREFGTKVRNLVNSVLEPAGFYQIGDNTYLETRRKLLFFKDVIENKGGHALFYQNGQPIRREADVHILFRLTWHGTPSDVSREVNDGRGPADFKVSRGARDKTLVEFKLASNTQLERNLQKQAATYEKASDPTHPSLKAILFFSEGELKRVRDILKRLELDNDEHIILIDARSDNKPSGSKA